MTDVATASLRGLLGFAASRLGQASATTARDAGALVGSLAGGAQGAPSKTRLDQLKADIEALRAVAQPIIDAVRPKCEELGQHASRAVTELGTDPFTLAAAGRVATEIASAMMALDEAIEVIATAVAKQPDGTEDQAIHDAVVGIKEPWVAPFRDVAAAAGPAFDAFAALLGIEGAAGTLAGALAFDRANYRVSLQLAASGPHTPVTAMPALRLNDTRLEAFLSWNKRPAGATTVDAAVFGLRVYTVIQAGLTTDPLLAQVLPGSPPPAETKPTAVTLDTLHGLTLGDGDGAERAVLPVAFGWPGVELREMALGITRNPAREATGLELTTTVAGRFGDAVGAVVEGGGLVIALDGQPGPAAAFPFAVSPRIPDAAGVRVKAAAIQGGGYLFHKDHEYGGVLDLRFAGAGITAIGLIATDPFSMVVVIGVHFAPAIELSFGFTLNGVGGLLAVDRAIALDALRKDMQAHVVDNLLFPDDPVNAAPTILQQLREVFPPQPGAFVVGPILELGWGSQAKIITAKLGVVLSMPDPKLVILGALRITAPARQLPITDLRAEVYGEVTADHLLVLATLADSTIAGIPISGDLGFLVAWGGSATFALSVGGFHPRYPAVPPELTGLRRLTIDLSPPAVVTIKVEAYFALTPGALMLGARGTLVAALGPVQARGELSIDAIFHWSPTVGFDVDLHLRISVEVFGHTFAGVSFDGELSGTAPWLVHGTATVDVWFLPTVHVDVGPISWGADGAPPEPAVDTLRLVRDALQAEPAWRVAPPDGTDNLVRLRAPDAGLDGGTDGLLAHPLAGLEIVQSVLPLETEIARVGSAPVTSHRLHLEAPTTSAGEFGALSTVRAPFAPGRFLALTDDELLSRPGFEPMTAGCRLAATAVPACGTASDGSVEWHTYFHRDDLPPVPGGLRLTALGPLLLRGGQTARLARDRRNPYSPAEPDGVRLAPAGTVQLRNADDRTIIQADLGGLGATEAAGIAAALVTAGSAPLVTVAVGVQP